MDSCIVLRSTNYKEYDRIITLLSRENGRIDAQVRGARQVKSQFATASQVFCCAQYEFYQKGGKFFVTDASVVHDFYGIQSDYEKFTPACVMIELAEKLLQHTTEHELLYDLLLRALLTLQKTADGKLALALFLADAVRFLGILPQLDGCVICGDGTAEEAGVFSYEEGGMVCGKCTSGGQRVRLSKRFLQVTRCLLDGELPETGTIQSGDLVRFFEQYVLVQTGIVLRTMKCV